MADSSDHVDRPITPLVAALWTMALWLTEETALELTESARAGASHDVVNIGACTVLATSLVIFAMVRVHARDVSLRATLGVTGIAPLQFVLAVAAGAGLCPVLSMVDDRVLARWPFPAEDAAVNEAILAVPTLSSRVALVAVVALVIPLARELFFRGILFGELRRTVGSSWAVLATAVFFMCCAPGWRVMPTAFVLGLALARVRDRTGTVLAAIVAHLAYWAVLALPIVRGADPMADVTYSTRWIVGGAVISLLALVAIGAGRQED
jgi:membrane protease YdiL (CAAX protease family)